MKHSLLDKLLSRIPAYSYPNNPRNKKAEKKQPNYIFVATKVISVKHPDTGVVSQRIVGYTYRRPAKKLPSKRDLHRTK